MNEEPLILKMRLFILDKQEAAFIVWQTKLNAMIASYPGFVSLEILSPIPSIQPEWLIIQRFSTYAQLIEWRNSPTYDQLLAELKPLLLKKTDALEEMETFLMPMQMGVTEIIITEIDPKKSELFRNWIAKIHQTETKFPGFRGTYVQSPTDSGGKNWITLLQFDTLANLEHWLQSKERAEILQESTSMITSLETQRVLSSYAGWFSSLIKKNQVPALWKQTMIILLVLFPIVMFELKYLSPQLKTLNSAVATFIGNAISVMLISWPMMPIALYFLSWWLSPQISQKATFLGTLLVIGIYLLEIALFFYLL